MSSTIDSLIKEVDTFERVINNRIKEIESKYNIKIQIEVLNGIPKLTALADVNTLSLI